MSEVIKKTQEVRNKGPAYGAASLTRVLNGIIFPVTKQELINIYGDKEVHYSKSNQLTLKDLVDRCAKDNFSTMSELVEACARRTINK